MPRSVLAFQTTEAQVQSAVLALLKRHPAVAWAHRMNTGVAVVPETKTTRRLYYQVGTRDVQSSIEIRSLTVSESIRRVLAVIATVIGIVFACEALARPCTSPDNLTRVTGGNECLVIHTFGAAVGNRTLVVFIHGDGSKGGPSDYLAKAAERVAGDGVTGVVLIRPGYYDSDGAKSTGTSYRRRGDGYRDNIIAAVAGAVAELKSHHSADRVVLVGHSGGAAISGVILGKFPGLANAAVLAACPCNVTKWRSMRGRGPWTRSRSPHRFLDAVPTNIEVVALTGRKDKNTKPVLAREYVVALKEPGQPHIKSPSHQYLISEVIAEPRPNTLFPDTDLRCLTLQQVHRHMPNHTHIMGPIASTNPTLVFPERDVQPPMQPILDSPVPTYRVSK